MLKGLAGVRTHEHREWLPIVANRQDWHEGAPSITRRAGRASRPRTACCSAATGSTRGASDVAEARRHLEVLEFLLEVVGRAGERTPRASRGD